MLASLRSARTLRLSHGLIALSIRLLILIDAKHKNTPDTKPKPNIIFLSAPLCNEKIVKF